MFVLIDIEAQVTIIAPEIHDIFWKALTSLIHSVVTKSTLVKSQAVLQSQVKSSHKSK